MLKTSRLLVLLFACLCLFGCGDSKLVGSWNVPLEGGAKGTMTFSKDGNLTMLVQDTENHITVTVTGTYSDGGDQLTMTMKNVEVTEIPDAMKAQSADLKSTFEKSLNVGVEKVANVKWTSDKSFTTTNPDSKVQLNFTKI